MSRRETINTEKWRVMAYSTDGRVMCDRNYNDESKARTAFDTMVGMSSKKLQHRQAGEQRFVTIDEFPKAVEAAP